MRMGNDRGDLIQRNTTNDCSVAFHFHKATIPRKVAAFLTYVDDLVQMKVPA